MSSILTRPGCSTHKLPPISADDRARLDSLMVARSPTLVDIERHVLQVRYGQLPQVRRLQVLARVRKEVGAVGVRILAGGEHRHG